MPLTSSSSTKRITIIAGTRPNFVKIAPIIQCIRKVQIQGIDIHYRLVHTGQHYDYQMSKTFFEELNIPPPDINLNCGKGTQTQQTADIMLAFEKELDKNPTDIILLFGDVTSTLACAIVAKKANIKIAHIEAGIRSFDISMPEEINRIVTDSITNYFFTTSEIANKNLRNIGVKDENIYYVGNVMIDSLMSNINRFRSGKDFENLGLLPQRYIVLTIHRRENIYDDTKLKKTIEEIIKSSNGMPIIFPVHPHTAKIMSRYNVSASNLHTIPPQGYLEFNYLVKNSFAVITDSGGISEEATVMHIPCLTLRDNTERPETCTLGTNMLIGANAQNITSAMRKLYSGKWPKGKIPDLWDGKAAARIVNTLLKL